MMATTTKNESKCERLTLEELAKLPDDTIDYSDIPPLTDEQLKRAIGVPAGKYKLSSIFLERREELVKQQKKNGFGYTYLQPDDKFWEEAEQDSPTAMDDAIQNLVKRSQAETRSLAKL